MTLFHVDVVTKEQAYQVLVYAESGIAARAHLRSKFPGSELQNLREFPPETKHFVIAERAKS